jgi:hypothetical protein
MSQARKPCTYIDGIASSQAIDTAGEIVDLKGLDISSLVGAAFNWEHQKEQPSQIVGKILEAKKIFSKEDCENDRQLFYWGKCQLPFLYVMGRLLDDKKPSAVEVAALFQDDAEHPNEPDMVGFSIEGAKVEKVGVVVTRSIARKCTITHIPANKQCIAEMLPMVSNKPPKDDLSNLFKGEMELFKFEPTYQEIMEKKEKDLKKDVGTGGGAFIGSQMAMSEKNMKKGSYQYGIHGPVESGSGISIAGQALRGTKHSKPDVGAAKQIHQEKLREATYSPSPKLPKSEGMNKALEAGSAMAAPGQLVQGAALTRESLEGLNNRSKRANSLAKGEKSKHFERADKAYQGWSDREKFRGYMKKRMPHLADGEIDAFGRILALKKDMDKEKGMNKMFASTYGKSEAIQKTTDVMMASEDKSKK